MPYFLYSKINQIKEKNRIGLAISINNDNCIKGREEGDLQQIQSKFSSDMSRLAFRRSNCSWLGRWQSSSSFSQSQQGPNFVRRRFDDNRSCRQVSR